MYRQTDKQITTSTIIHCIITFVASYYNKDFHIPTNVINPCKLNSHYICGKSRVTFAVGSGYYLCEKTYYICGFITLNAADFYYICGLFNVDIITLVGIKSMNISSGFDSCYQNTSCSVYEGAAESIHGQTVTCAVHLLPLHNIC